MSNAVRKTNLGCTMFVIPDGVRCGEGATFRATAENGSYVDLVIDEVHEGGTARASIVDCGRHALAPARPRR